MGRFEGHIRAAPHSIVNFVQHGDLHTYRTDPGYRIGPLPSRPAPSARKERHPSRLLLEAHRFVGFYGRIDELAQLRAWRDSPDRFGILLIHGVGGQGKTRLARHFAAQSAGEGWAPLAADLGSRSGTDQLPVGSRRWLLVIDYAERWPAAVLRALLGDARLHDHPVRILLLARPAGGWWRRVARHAADQFDAAPAVLPLLPLPTESGQREMLFVAARDGFAQALEVPGAVAAVPAPDWSPDATALEIQMTALASVYAHRGHEEVPTSPGALSAYLLEREYGHWADLHENGLVGTRPQLMARAVYLACLTGPLRHREAASLVTGTGLTAPGEETGRLLDDHEISYPGSVLAPIQPDRMAEDYVALCGTGSPSVDAGHWAEGVLGSVLNVLADSAPHRINSLLTTAITVAERWAAFSQELGAVIRDRPEMVVAGGGPLLSALSRLTELDTATLTALESVMPTDGPADVMEPLAILTERLYRKVPASSTTAARRAWLGYRLARRWLRAGVLRRALPPVDEAIGVFTAATDLARAYGCRAEIYTSLGRYHDGARDSLRSLRYWGRTVDPEHAAQLETYARLLAATAQPEHAIVHQRRATVLWRKLAGADAGMTVHLARSLTVRVTYERSQSHDDSSTTAREAAEVWERLHQAAGDGSYRRELLDALSVVATSTRMPRTLRLDAAERAARGFADLWPQDVSLLPRATLALAVWAATLRNDGRHQEAVDRAYTACGMSDWLVKRNSARYSQLQAAVLVTYARCCLSANVRPRHARDAAETAARVFEPAAEGNSEFLDPVALQFLVADPYASGPAKSPEKPPRAIAEQPKLPDRDGACVRCHGTGVERREEWGRDRVRTQKCSRCGGRRWLRPGE